MTIAHVRAEPAIITRSGIAADFAIHPPGPNASGRQYCWQMCSRRVRFRRPSTASGHPGLRPGLPKFHQTVWLCVLQSSGAEQHHPLEGAKHDFATGLDRDRFAGVDRAWNHRHRCRDGRPAVDMAYLQSMTTPVIWLGARSPHIAWHPKPR